MRHRLCKPEVSFIASSIPNSRLKNDYNFDLLNTEWEGCYFFLIILFAHVPLFYMLCSASKRIYFHTAPSADCTSPTQVSATQATTRAPSRNRHPPPSWFTFLTVIRLKPYEISWKSEVYSRAYCKVDLYSCTKMLSRRSVIMKWQLITLPL